jgi:hypothetical protein
MARWKIGDRVDCLFESMQPYGTQHSEWIRILSYNEVFEGAHVDGFARDEHHVGVDVSQFSK